MGAVLGLFVLPLCLNGCFFNSTPSEPVRRHMEQLNHLEAEHTALSAENLILREENKILRDQILSRRYWTDTTELDRVGGTGGAPFIRLCPENYAVSEINARAGEAIDSLGIECQHLYEENSPSATSHATLENIGGPGGNPVSRSCPNDTVLGGISGRHTQNLITSIELLCIPVDASRTEGVYSLITGRRTLTELEGRIVGRIGSSSGTPFWLMCPDNMVVVGFTGTAGLFLDSMTPLCGETEHRDED
jgi:hypothetical protein